MPDESELIAMRSAEVTEPDLSRLSPTERAGDRVRRLWGGFVEQGFAAGYDQGWNDAKAGRQYGEGRNGERPILNRQDGHEGCRTAFQRDLQGLRDEVDHLRRALRIVTNEDGCSAEALADARFLGWTEANDA